MRREALLVIALVSALPASVRATGSTSEDYWYNLWRSKLDYYANAKLTDAHSSGIMPWDLWDSASRVELMDSEAEYMATLMRTGGLWADPQVEDYLHQLLLRVHPQALQEGRPGRLAIRVLRDPAPNAFAMCDGTILVTTGLITFVATEDELLAAIAHEVAHVVLDHNLRNYSAEKSRAAFSAMLGAVAGVAAGIATADRQRGESFNIGAAIGVGLATGVVSSKVVEAIGAKYSRDQEIAADAAAKTWLVSTGIDSAAIHGLLSRFAAMRQMYGASGSSLMDSHPNTEQRIRALGFSGLRVIEHQAEFDERVASALTYTGALAAANLEWREADDLLERAISSGWASSDTYVLKALTTRYLDGSRAASERSLVLLDQAERIDQHPIAWLHAERALHELRLGKRAEAIGALEAFQAQVAGDPSKEWLADWARRLASQIRGAVGGSN